MHEPHGTVSPQEIATAVRCLDGKVPEDSAELHASEPHEDLIVVSGQHDAEDMTVNRALEQCEHRNAHCDQGDARYETTAAAANPDASAAEDCGGSQPQPHEHNQRRHHVDIHLVEDLPATPQVTAQQIPDPPLEGSVHQKALEDAVRGVHAQRLCGGRRGSTQQGALDLDARLALRLQEEELARASKAKMTKGVCFSATCFLLVYCFRMCITPSDSSR
jgi:hypothetical protein